MLRRSSSRRNRSAPPTRCRNVSRWINSVWCGGEERPASIIISIVFRAHPASLLSIWKLRAQRQWQLIMPHVYSRTEYGRSTGYGAHSCRAVVLPPLPDRQSICGFPMFVSRISSDEYGDLLKYVPGWIGQLPDIPLRCTFGLCHSTCGLYSALGPKGTCFDRNIQNNAAYK